MSNLEIALLAHNTELCYEYSRDNATFSLGQRNQWLIKGFEQKSRLNELIGKEMLGHVGPKVIEANTKLKAINKRLKDKQESLNKFSETVQNINDVISILDILIGLAIPN